MTEVLQFVFSSFWTWSGTMVLLIACGELAIAVGRAIGHAIRGTLEKP